MTTELIQTYPSRTLVIPDDSYTDLYAIFYDINTGDMFHATTGVINTTWGNCDVVAAKHASNKGVWLLSTPPMSKFVNVGVNLFDAAAPANTDAIIKALKYDPKRNVTYTDSVPTGLGKAFVR
jgi:hypothetical protein